MAVMAFFGVLGCVLSVGWHTSMPSPIFNISSFGAKGDNFTSNTHAFKAAVASIETAGVDTCRYCYMQLAHAHAHAVARTNARVVNKVQYYRSLPHEKMQTKKNADEISYTFSQFVLPWYH